MTHSVVWAMGCSVAVRRTPGRGNVLLSQDIPEIAYELLPGTPAPCLGKLGRDVTSLTRLRGDVTPPDAASSLSPITRLCRTRHTPSTNSAQPVDPWLLCSRRYSRHRGCRLWCSQSNSTMGISMLAYVVSEGRLFALKPSEWSLLLGGVMFCGLLTLLFG